MTTTITKPAMVGNRPRTSQLAAEIFLASFWLLLIAVISLWVAGRGLQELSRWPQALTSAGRLAGLIAASLMLVQVLVMARIPALEQAFGQPDLARWHRWVGFTSFNLMVAHVMLVVLGYALSVQMNPLVQFWDLITGYPGMLLALAGTLLLIMITVTSLRRARRRLRYESWHLLHLYTYLGAGLAVPHMLWTGQEFVGNPLSAAIGWVAWGLALASVIIWRFALPLVRSLAHDLRVERVRQEGPGVVSVEMRGKDLDSLRIAAGQFANWRFLNGPGWTRAHPFSLSAVPTPTSLRITVKNLGDGSGALADLRPGTRVLFEGPFGRLHAGVRTRAKVLLMAAGIGITPLRALLEDLPQAPGEVTMIYRANTEADLTFRDEIDALAISRRARVLYLVGPPIYGRTSWLPSYWAHLSDAEALRQLVPDVVDHDAFLCGVPAWMDAATAALRACGVRPGNIHSERFSW